MKLSVCLITYNHEKFIRQALDGVLAQRVDFPWEVVVGEDCSTDRTGEVVGEYAARRPDLIRVLPTPHNLGGFGKPNLVRTLAACSGEYVALLEGDDYWTDPLKLARQVAFLDARPTHSFAFHQVWEVDELKCRRRVRPDTPRTEFGFDDLFPDNFIPTCSTVFRRSALGPLPDWFHTTVMSDWPIHLLCARGGQFGRVSGVMAVFRVHNGGVWSPVTLPRRLTASLHMLAVAKPYFDPSLAPHFDRAVALMRFQRVWAYLDDGESKTGRKEFASLLADRYARQFIPLLGWVALHLKTRWPWLYATAARFNRAARPPSPAGGS